MKEKLIEAVIKKKKDLPYTNLSDDNKYLGWVSNFNVDLPDGQRMYLDLKIEQDLFLLFVLASAWSKTGPWENAAYFVIYLKLSQKSKPELWLDKDFVEQEMNNRAESCEYLSKMCGSLNSRKKVSFRKDYYDSVAVLAEEWIEIKEVLLSSYKDSDYNTFINHIGSIEGLGAKNNKMRIKIPLILRELRCQNIFGNIPGELCCVTDERVKKAAQQIGINLPSIVSIKDIMKSSKIIYDNFGDLYDIPLFAFDDVRELLYEDDQYTPVLQDKQTELADEEIIKTIDRAIKEIWMNEILEDYCDGTLLKEDTLKNALYHHLRVRLDDFLKRNNLRIYTEFDEKGIKEGMVRADLAIVKMGEPEDNSKYLGKCVNSVLAIIELKYKTGGGKVIDIIRQDIEKMKEYIKAFDFENCQYYLGIIHEYQYPNWQLKWLDKRQSNNWAKGRLTELSACYYKQNDQADENKIGFSVCSYNDLNNDLDSWEFEKIKFKLMDLNQFME